MTSASPHIHRWRAFALLAVTYFMTIVDLTIVNVSLPTIGRDLHFSPTSLQWVATAYLLTFGGFLLLGGRAADLLGRRRVLMSGLGLFSAASLACALAAGDGFLIGARAAQGVGAAVMLPAALSIVMNMFDEGAERNKALGIWGAIAASGAIVGLITGGLLTRYAGWQYIFYLNVPIGAAALLLVPRIVPESRVQATGRPRFDALGVLAGTGGLVLLVDAISQAPQYGWGGARTDVLLAVAGALLVTFLVIECRVESPVVPLSIVARNVGDSGGARRPVAVAGHSCRAQGRDGDRDDADRHGRDLGDPGACPRSFRRESARPVHACRREGGVRVHPDFDRRPGRCRGASGGACVRTAEHQPAASAGRSGSRSPRASPPAAPTHCCTPAGRFPWR